MRGLLGLLLLAGFWLRAETPTYITFPSDVDWVTQETDHFHVLFRRGEDGFAQRTLKAAERAHSLLAPIFKETPPKTWIVLSDFHDSLNGYAIDYPFPHFVLFANPPEPSSQLAALDDWLDSLVLHEYVHVLHLYPAHGIWSALKSVFGSWVLPNGMLPSHLHEGLATFFETEFSRGGRGRGTSFNMITRMAVKEGVWGKEFVPLDLLEGSIRWPQGMSAYYFGYQIYAELWSRKKAAGIHSFVQDTSGRLLPYWVSKSTQDIYGLDYPSLWAGIFDKTRERVRDEIQDIEQRPLSNLKYVTDSRYHKWDLTLSPDGKKLAYRRTHPNTGNALEIRTIEKPGDTETIDLEAGHQEGMCWVVRNGKQFLVFAESEYEYGYQLNSLRVLDTSNREKITPQSNGEKLFHIQTIGCGEDGKILTYQERSGHGTVKAWVTSADWKEWKAIAEWTVPEGQWVTSLLHGRTPQLALRRSVSTDLYEWPAGNDPKKIWEISGHFYKFGPALPSGEILAVGTVSGREEVWALDPRRKWARKIISVLGGLNSFDHLGDRWWINSYRHGGYDIAEATPIHDTGQKLGETPAILRKTDEAPQMGKARDYSGFSSMMPRAWIPSMLIVPAGMQFSAWVPGFDVSQKHFYNLVGGYDTRGSVFFVGDYSYRFGSSQQINVDVNVLPAYLITSRTFLHTWGASIGYSTRLGVNLPLVALSAIFKRVESSALGPEVQSVGFSVGLSQTLWAKTPPRAIAPSLATKIGINYSQFFQAVGSRDNYYAATLSLDQYVKAPWLDRHVFKLGIRLGATQGTPLYNSFFQGGGELQFSPGRGFFMNRGFYPGTFLSQKMATINFDYLFPIVEIERGYNQWPFFLKRIDGALVADTTTLGNLMYYYSSTGVELKSYWKAFFYFPSVVRFGAYHGFGPYGESLYTMMAVEATI